MNTILLSIEKFGDEQRLFASFPYDAEIINLIKQIPGATWSQSRKKWHFN